MYTATAIVAESTSIFSMCTVMVTTDRLESGGLAPY